MEPQGRFGAALAKSPRHILAVAGGSGITPILSILKTALATGARCTLLYGNRNAASTMFKEELEDLKNRHLTTLAVHPVFSRENVDSPLNSGRLDGAKIAAFLRLCGAVDQAFVCGPHAMNDEVEAALLAAGIAREHVHVERFGVPPSEADATLHAPKEGDATRVWSGRNSPDATPQAATNQLLASAGCFPTGHCREHTDLHNSPRGSSMRAGSQFGRRRRGAPLQWNACWRCLVTDHPCCSKWTSRSFSPCRMRTTCSRGFAPAVATSSGQP